MPAVPPLHCRVTANGQARSALPLSSPSQPVMRLLNHRPRARSQPAPARPDHPQRCFLLAQPPAAAQHQSRPVPLTAPPAPHTIGHRAAGQQMGPQAAVLVIKYAAVLHAAASCWQLRQAPLQQHRASGSQAACAQDTQQAPHMRLAAAAPCDYALGACRCCWSTYQAQLPHAAGRCAHPTTLRTRRSRGAAARSWGEPAPADNATAASSCTTCAAAARLYMQHRGCAARTLPRTATNAVCARGAATCMPAPACRGPRPLQLTTALRAHVLQQPKG